MKIEYYRETDTLYIELLEKPSVAQKEADKDIVFDFDEENNIVGIEIEHAGTHVDLNSLNAVSFPFLGLKKSG